MAFQNLMNEYLAIPPITRGYSTLCVVTTLCVHLEVVTPFQLYFNPTLILKQYQLWRLLTTFLYFGTVSFSFVFNMIFTYRYCRMLEENSFRGRTADFMMMFIFGGVIMIFFAFFIHLIFLGQAFTIMIVYIWSRRNPFLRMNFFGLLNFQAPYLPYVLLAFSVILGNTVWVDLMGMAVGHIYYFLEDVFPHQPNGCKLLKTPQVLKNIFDQPPDDTDYGPLPEAEDRPGGFNWGGDRPPPPPPAGEAGDAQEQQPAPPRN